MNNDSKDGVRRRNSQVSIDGEPRNKENHSPVIVNRKASRVSMDGSKSHSLLLKQSRHSERLAKYESSGNFNRHVKTIAGKDNSDDEEPDDTEIPEKRSPIRGFLHYYKKSFVHRKMKKNVDEVLSGVTVALAQIPEGMAFSFVANVNPAVGLNATFILGIVTSLLGGRPGMVSGASGSISVNQAAIVNGYGIDVLFLTVAAMGIFQIIIALLNGDKLIMLLSEPVLIGFLNGLAIIIGIAQLESFRSVCGNDNPYTCPYMEGMDLFIICMFVLGSFLFILFVPMIPKVGKIIPSSLLALIICTLINEFGDIGSKTVGDVASVKGKFPTFYWPVIEWTWENVSTILFNGFIWAVIGLTETLVTIQPLDDLIENKGNGKWESVAQGIGNFICGMVRGLGGSTMIGQSQINVQSGGTKRLSTFIASVGVLIIILAAYSLMNLIPVGALIGLMFVVVFKTFYWPTFLIFNKMKVQDIIIIFVVTLATIFINLAIAVISGIAMSALFYSWERGKELTHTSYVTRKDEEERKTYLVNGELMFGSSKLFEDFFKPKTDPAIVELDAEQMRIRDYTGVDALKRVLDKYVELKKKFIVSNLDERSEWLISKSKLFKEEFIAD